MYSKSIFECSSENKVIDCVRRQISNPVQYVLQTMRNSLSVSKCYSNISVPLTVIKGLKTKNRFSKAKLSSRKAGSKRSSMLK